MRRRFWFISAAPLICKQSSLPLWPDSEPASVPLHQFPACCSAAHAARHNTEEVAPGCYGELLHCCHDTISLLHPCVMAYLGISLCATHTRLCSPVQSSWNIKARRTFFETTQANNHLFKTTATTKRSQRTCVQAVLSSPWYLSWSEGMRTVRVLPSSRSTLWVLFPQVFKG